MPVPIAIRVNMLSFIVRTEIQARAKNGHPPHKTTGVASTSWVHVEALGEIRSCIAGNRCPPISRTTTGIESSREIQNRRVMSRSSALGPSSAVTMTGLSAIPQMGHEPGPI